MVDLDGKHIYTNSGLPSLEGEGDLIIGKAL